MNNLTKDDYRILTKLLVKHRETLCEYTTDHRPLDYLEMLIELENKLRGNLEDLKKKSIDNKRLIS